VHPGQWKGILSGSGRSSLSWLGLIGMEERIHLMKGIFRVRTYPGTGIEVYAWVPVPDLVHEVVS